MSRFREKNREVCRNLAAYPQARVTAGGWIVWPITLVITGNVGKRPGAAISAVRLQYLLSFETLWAQQADRRLANAVLCWRPITLAAFKACFSSTIVSLFAYIASVARSALLLSSPLADSRGRFSCPPIATTIRSCWPAWCSRSGRCPSLCSPSYLYGRHRPCTARKASSGDSVLAWRSPFAGWSAQL